ENLVGRRIGDLSWAIYAATPPDGSPLPTLKEALASADWVALGEGYQHVQAAKFVREHVPPERISIRINSVLGLAEAVESGAGVGPRPCFAADVRPGLARISGIRDDFTSGLWLLTHPELQRSPRVRVFMDMVGKELDRMRPLLSGSLPKPE